MCEKPSPQPPDEEANEPRIAPEDFKNADGFERLVQMVAEKDSTSPPPTVTQLRDALQPIIQRLDDMRDQQAVDRQQISALASDIQELKTQDRVLTELHDQVRRYSEQFHERELLQPVFRGLIAIADSCRRQERQLRQALQKHGDSSNQLAVSGLRRLLEARAANRVEVEDLLANYGVEPFTQLEDTFDPKVQMCVSRVACEEKAFHGRVAERLLPGYRRNGTVLRPECVTVFVVPHSNGGVS